MLVYDRINISEGIDVDRTNATKECKICHYWYFKDIGTYFPGTGIQHWSK